MRDKAFIITVDTEGDNCWRTICSENSVNNRITVKNGQYIARFQKLCEKYCLKPTYLVNYEMCFSKEFVEITLDALQRGTCEIGMHMHGWSTPPFYALKRSSDTGSHNAYIGEYPVNIIEEKVHCLTETIKDVFHISPKSHRSGRWYLDKDYVRVLGKNGYDIDCSVTPGISWTNHPGRTKGSCGTDYTDFPNRFYEISVDDISRAGKSGFYELPVTTFLTGLGECMFRPNGKNFVVLLDILKNAKREYVG